MVAAGHRLVGLARAPLSAVATGFAVGVSDIR